MDSRQAQKAFLKALREVSSIHWGGIYDCPRSSGSDASSPFRLHTQKAYKGEVSRPNTA
jgi:hypothetical protein